MNTALSAAPRRPYRWLAAPAAAAAAIGVGTGFASRRWRRDTDARLAGGGRLAATALGPIEYAETGSGAPVLVLHGTPGGYDQALAVAGLFAGSGVRVIAMSRPGYLGTPLSVSSTPAEQADAATALVDHLQIDRTAVVGVSGGGGMAAVQLALRHRGRVARLVLWEAVTAAVAFGTDNLTRGPLTTDVAAWLMLRAFTVAPRLLVPPRLDADPQALTRLGPVAASGFPLQPRRDGIANDGVQARALPDSPLEEIDVPTLLVHGTEDTNVPYRLSEQAAQRIPGSRLVSVPGGDHTTTLVDTRAVTAIERFLHDSR